MSSNPAPSFASDYESFYVTAAHCFAFRKGPILCKIPVFSDNNKQYYVSLASQ